MLVYSAIDALTGRPRPPGGVLPRDDAPQTPPAPLAVHEITRVRAAVYRATRLYPGPVGELVARELTGWAEFGYRFDERGVAGRLVHHLMTTPLPGEQR